MKVKFNTSKHSSFITGGSCGNQSNSDIVLSVNK